MVCFLLNFFFFVWRIAKIVEFSWWRTVEFYINMDYAHEKVSNHYFVFIYLFYLLWVKICFAVVLWWIWLTKKLSKFFLYMDRRVYLRVCKRLLTEQQRRRKKIKFFFWNVSNTCVETKEKENKAAKKIATKTENKNKNIVPISFGVCDFVQRICVCVYLFKFFSSFL